MDEREEDIEETPQYQTNGKINFSKKRASWTEPQKAYLIELLHLYNDPHHRGNIGWNKSGWTEITKRFNTKFPRANYNMKQLKEQEQAFKKAYKAIKGLIDDNGFKWDENAKRVVAPNNDILEDLFENSPVAKEWHNKTFLYYTDLGPLYSGCIGEVSHRRSKIQVSRPQIIRENVNGSPKPLLEPCRTSNVLFEEEDFINIENVPNLTHNITSIQNLTEIPVPQQDASSKIKSRRKKKPRNLDEYLECKKPESYVGLMKEQVETSRLRLEIEKRRAELEFEKANRQKLAFEIEMKYSFKNAIDLFGSLDGFSFEDYDKVTSLFMKDEKIRDAFIDVKDEYKARWIRLRINDS